MGGNSDSGTMEPEASGDEARGRVDEPPFLWVRGPPESRDDEGTASDTAC